MNSGIKGIILAAGKGTRISALSNGVPKLLLKIGGKRFVELLTMQLLDAGIDDIVVITREGTTDGFKRVFDEEIELPLNKLSFAEVPHSNNNILDTMHSIRDHVDTEKMIYSCDVLLEDTLRPAVLAFSEQRAGARTVSSYMDDTAGFSHIGVDGDKIMEFNKKDSELHRSGLIDLGFWMFHTDVFSTMEQLLHLDESMGTYELNKHFVDMGMHHHTEAKGWWSDLGKSCAEFNSAKAYFSQGEP